MYIYTHICLYMQRGCIQVHKTTRGCSGHRFTWKAAGQEAQQDHSAAPGTSYLQWKDGSLRESTRQPTRQPRAILSGPPKRQLKCKELRSLSGRYRSLRGLKATRTNTSYNNSTGTLPRVPIRDMHSYKNHRAQHSPKIGLPIGYFRASQLKCSLPIRVHFDHKPCCLVSLVSWLTCHVYQVSRATAGWLTKGQIFMQWGKDFVTSHLSIFCYIISIHMNKK